MTMPVTLLPLYMFSFQLKKTKKTMKANKLNFKKFKSAVWIFVFALFKRNAYMVENK